MSTHNRSLVWFRRDLRDFDHAALHVAMQSSNVVFCAFVFDSEILDPLLQKGLKADRRVEFIFDSVQELDQALRERGGGLIVRHGLATVEIPRLADALQVDAVFINRDYEPAAVARDAAIEAALHLQDKKLLSFKDQVIFEKSEVLTQSGRPYGVFTPYKNAWLKKLAPDEPGPVTDMPALCAYLPTPPSSNLAAPPEPEPSRSLEALGFVRSNLRQLGIATGMSGGAKLIADFVPRLARYDHARDYPSVKGPSYLSVHLRFGTVPVRGLVRMALEAMHSGAGGDGARTWLNELIWRDFYFMILHHFPHVVEHAFRPEFDRVTWEDGAQAKGNFAAWCDGRTGYPLVDAAMLQLNQTGYMHNRLRMVTASFLVKDLGIDWRLGEGYFAERLNDYDLAANNGGWQWSASTGCDAQPWFRIFNPTTQSQRFDADGKFIRKYLPVLDRLSPKDIHAPWLATAASLDKAGVRLGENYPFPVIAHDQARKKTLERYGVVKKIAGSEQ